MAAVEPRPGDDVSHEELVRHLVRCMEQADMVIEAADAPDHPKPSQTKASGLRRRRARPDVVAKDGRRTVFGEAVTGAEAGDARVPDQLETLARHCRVLVVCIPEEVADDAIETFFLGRHLPRWHKMRVLRYPAEGWQELPKAAGRKGPRPG